MFVHGDTCAQLNNCTLQMQLRG